MALSVVGADAQRVDRTRSLVARSQEDYLLASIQLAGSGRVHQDGRVAGLRPGSMAFYDSTRPYTLDVDRTFRQLVIQVPRRAVPHGRARDAAAVALEASGPGRLVADFVGTARSAEDVASACHISRRTLFRVLAADGCTFRELVPGLRPTTSRNDRCSCACPANPLRADGAQG